MKLTKKEWTSNIYILGHSSLLGISSFCLLTFYEDALKKIWCVQLWPAGQVHCQLRPCWDCLLRYQLLTLMTSWCLCSIHTLELACLTFQRPMLKESFSLIINQLQTIALTLGILKHWSGSFYPISIASKALRTGRVLRLGRNIYSLTIVSSCFCQCKNDKLLYNFLKTLSGYTYLFLLLHRPVAVYGPPLDHGLYFEQWC